MYSILLFVVALTSPAAVQGQSSLTVAPVCPTGMTAYYIPGTTYAQTCIQGSYASCPTGYSCTYTQFGSSYCCASSTNRQGRVGAQCASGGYCYENGAICDTGYCKCRDGYEYDSISCQKIPKLGEFCDRLMKCSTTNAVCSPKDGSYVCQCMTQNGYIPSGDACVRSRKELDAACTYSAECVAAYSECKDSKCKCRDGFTGASGVCQPAKQNCVLGDDPYKKDGKVFECKKTAVGYGLMTNAVNATTPKPAAGGRRKRTAVMTPYPAYPGYYNNQWQDDCPKDDPAAAYYCVSYYDQGMDAYGSAVMKGFCCKQLAPKCPAGGPHESSKAPKWGCDSCPYDTHYCHVDGHATKQSVCCPKACASVEDIYQAGKCYSPAMYGQACEIDSQCVGVQGSKCIEVTTGNKQCSCPTGQINLAGYCTKPRCSSSYANPMMDNNGKILRCQSPYLPAPGPQDTNVLARCPTGNACDSSYGVCCPDMYRTCPNGGTYVSGSYCSTYNECQRYGGNAYCSNGICCYGSTYVYGG